MAAVMNSFAGRWLPEFLSLPPDWRRLPTQKFTPPVRVLRLVAGRPKLHELRPVVKQIYRLSAPFQMTALDDHALRPEPFDGLSGLAHVI
jgi:hypothetical protein